MDGGCCGCILEFVSVHARENDHIIRGGCRSRTKVEDKREVSAAKQVSTHPAETSSGGQTY